MIKCSINHSHTIFFSRPTLDWYYLVAIGVLNAIGYIIFRASETQRCEFAKDPNSSAMKSTRNLTNGCTF